MASAAHAEDVPSNAELFRMLKAQQQTISELRAELKQAKQERRTATPREAPTAPAAKPAGRDAAKETVAVTPPAQAYAMYNKGPAVLPARTAVPMSVFSVAAAVAAALTSASSAPSFSLRPSGAPWLSTPQGGPAAAASGSVARISVMNGRMVRICGPLWRSKVSIWQVTSRVRRW